ncbi:MAG: zinc-dependent alcohol dehydrogenase family protein [Fuerstiella sp.]
MKAAIFEDYQGPLTVADVPSPDCPSDGVIIDVQACGVCRSDWHGWMGHDTDVKLPHVPGHELAGIVSSTGQAVTRWKIGDRVTVPFCCGCGDCSQCNKNCEHICDNYFQPGVTYWGGFAEQVAIPKADVNLIKLPDQIDFAAAASLGCRFATSFRAVVEQGQVKPTDTVAVFGCGGVGLSAIMIAKALGADVIAIDLADDRLAQAKSLGAKLTLNASTGADTWQEIRSVTNGGADVSFDAIGSKNALQNSVLSLRKQGRHVQIGLLLGDHDNPTVPMAAVIGRELELYGSHGMPPNAYPAMLEMITAGKLAPHKLVSKTLSLSEARDFLPEMNGFPGHGAVVITDFQN